MADQNASDCSLSGTPPYDCEGCNLSGMTLAGKDLRGANLKNTTLLGTIFKGVLSMDGVDLSGATMGEGTDFSGCDLTRTDFGVNPRFGSDPARPTVFRGATVPYGILGPTWQALDLAQATISGMPGAIEPLVVTQCDISGIDFSNKTLKNAHFASVVAHKTNFSGAILDNIVFGRQIAEQLTDLTGASFDGATINSGDFDDATLTEADFTNATSLSNTTFLDARMDGTRFDHTDLTQCSFSSQPRWSEEPGHNTSFNRATLKYSTIGKQWSFLDLADATLVGLDQRVDLTYLQARYAVLSGMDLSGYTLDHGDFTGASLAGTRFVGAHMDQAMLRGVQGEKPVFDDALLTGAYFDLVDKEDVQTNSSLHGASFYGANLQKANLSHADFGPAETGAEVFADFRKAQLNNLTAVRANFTGANLSGGLSMHGATFASATLAQADITGAVLGDLGNVFTMTSSESEYEQFVTALNAADVAGVKASFGRHGVQLASLTTIEITVAGKAWEVKEDRIAYTVLLVTASDGAKSMQVFQPAGAAAAELSGVFMPDAILNDANLCGVHAHAVQLFPTTSTKNQLAGAIMNNIDLSDSILGSDTAIDMKQANLVHANLTGAFLMNAELSGADLTGAFLDHAQLQGANFTDADLTAASLVDAAVSSLVLTSKDGTRHYGVPLFEVQLPDDALTELALFGPKKDDQAAYPFDLATEADDGYVDLLDDLKTGKLDPVLATLKQHGVTLSTTTTVESDAAGAAWLLTDPTPGQSAEYVVWDGFDVLGDKVINAQPNVPKISKLFQDGCGVRLRWQATISPIDAADGTQAWVIDNDSENPSNLLTGYVEFLVTQQTHTLSVFGTLIHATRLVSIDKQEMGVFQISGTVLCKNPPCNPDDTYLQSDTFCPNGAPLSANLRDHQTWAEMMHFANKLPLPPPCVPSPYAPCPQLVAVS